MRDSKIRYLRRDDGSKETYSLRRLLCRECGKLHTELPDKIQPYKHYASDVIEAELDESRKDCPADNSTISRWKSEFKKAAVQLEGILISSWIDHKKLPYPLIKENSLLKTLRKNGPGWLAVVTRMLVNTGFTAHTRFAFCPS